MPLCTEDTTSASHRPFFSLPTFLLLEAIRTSVSPDEPAPNEQTIRTAQGLVAEVPFHLVGEPDVNPFYGEIHLSWSSGSKQVILMFFPNRTPLIHHYERAAADTMHDIEEATADRVANWLAWLRA